MLFNLHKKKLAGALALCVALPAWSATMKPETSMVFIQEQEGGGSLNVTNTGESEALLYIKIYDLPDDKTPQLLVSQPVTRVPAGQIQRVRFVLNSSAPLTTEHMKRVIIEGIPPQTASGQNSVALNVRQDIPVIIHPQGLPVAADPWKALKWSAAAGTLTVSNPSPYVVRLAQEVSLLPSMKTVKLEKTYILPGQTLTAKAGNAVALSGAQQVQIQSLSKYGYVVGQFTSPLAHNG